MTRPPGSEPDPGSPSTASPAPPVPAPDAVLATPASEPPAAGSPAQIIPARMLNEFVYCPRLFYYEFVEGVFLDNADTLRGASVHRRVDTGSGELPPAAEKRESGPDTQTRRKTKTKDTAGLSPVAALEDQAARGNGVSEAEPEIIHSRSVQMGSDRLGVTAKMDLVEVRAALAQGVSAIPAPPANPGGETGDLFAALEVCPVDYKAGAPREGAEANELWDADKMQLGLQILILRDNGYACREGVIYYRATKQRVRLEMTAKLEAWIIEKIAEARRAALAPIPAPLVHSPKCPRCSLVTVCLPDETRLLGGTTAAAATRTSPPASAPRRLIAARDDCRALYLNQPGLRVGRKDEVLQVKEEKTLLDEVRVNDVSHVALFGNIQISTQAIQALCEAEVPVTYFSMGGWFYGITRGHELKNVFLRLEQFRLARDEGVCLRLARQFVHGKIRNHRTMLMRNHLEPPPAALLKLKQCADAALRAGSLEQLLGIEGGAAGAYFEQFGGMIKVADDLAEEQIPAPGVVRARTAFNFNFTHRNRRPPTDPVNALLSLAYSLLAKDCLLAALAVGFDPYVGFYHQPRFGRPALALDLMEEFRPLVAESTVLGCINNRAITADDFVRAGQAVNLTASGRKRFFQTYEQRMSSLLTHPLFEYKVSYRRAIELQARLLAKNLTGEISDYTPLMTR
jgi:CRISPR-associated protein Cas1